MKRFQLMTVILAIALIGPNASIAQSKLPVLAPAGGGEIDAILQRAVGSR